MNILIRRLIGVKGRDDDVIKVLPLIRLALLGTFPPRGEG